MSDQQPQTRPFGGFSGGGSYEGPLQDGKYYNATLSGLQGVHIDKGQWPGWKVEWEFGIDGADESVKALTSEATGESSTAGPWLIAMVGKARYDERETRTIAKEELVGRPCKVYVQFNDSGWPRVKGVFPREDVAAVPASPPQAQPAQAPSSPASAEPPNFDDLPF